MPAINKSGKQGQANRGSKSANFETNTNTENLAMAEGVISAKPINETPIKATVQEIEDAIVYDNGITSIDFMLPEDERAILEKNLGIYSDIEKMQKALNIAKKNKLISEELKSLEMVGNVDEFINRMMKLMSNPTTLDVLERYMQREFEEGDPSKALKHVGLVTKAFMDARETMIQKMRVGKSGKTARIALKFTNDSGEDFQLGAEIDG